MTLSIAYEVKLIKANETVSFLSLKFLMFVVEMNGWFSLPQQSTNDILPKADLVETFYEKRMNELCDYCPSVGWDMKI